VSDPAAPPGRIGCYETTAILGGGAMSTVYRAIDTRSGGAAALKLARRDAAADELTRRFAREAVIGRRIAHPRVIRILELGAHEGLPYLAMELIEGPTVMAVLEHGPILSAYAVAIVTRLAETLADLHEAGIVHRDVKPQNVILRRPLDPVLMDFGVAQMAGLEDDLTGELSGTPASMAPEQISGGPLDGRADVFALGVLLYRIVSGRRPFDGSAAEVAQQILYADPVPLGHLDPALPPALDAILAGALAKDPGRRLTAAGFAGELRALLEADRAAPPESRRLSR
jgi:serine/threonine-protein kinase